MVSVNVTVIKKNCVKSHASHRLVFEPKSWTSECLDLFVKLFWNVNLNLVIQNVEVLGLTEKKDNSKKQTNKHQSCCLTKAQNLLFNPTPPPPSQQCCCLSLKLTVFFYSHLIFTALMFDDPTNSYSS